MAKKKGKKKPTPAPPKFAVGDKVRVEPGTVDPDFEDVSLGGWAGTITEVFPDERPPTYMIVWDKPTLAQMRPALRRRCDREYLKADLMCLSEDDIVPDDGSPVSLE